MGSSKFGTIKNYDKNQIIFEEGHLGNVGYLIKTGEVMIYKIINGKKKILSKLGPGEVFGEMGIVTQAPRTAYAETTEYSELVMIDKKTLFTMLKQSSKLVQSITVLLIKRLSNTLKMLEDQESHSQNSKTMLRLYSLLDLMTRYDQGIHYDYFCEKAMDILCVNQVEIENIIKRLSKLKVLEVSGEFQKTKTSDCIIKIVGREALLKTV